jgi:hypothetical protein
LKLVSTPASSSINGITKIQVRGKGKTGGGFMADSAAIARALRGRKSGSGYLCRCPAHADARPSLLISDRDDGGVLIHCFAGCDWRAVLDKLRAMRLIEDRPSQYRQTVRRCEPVEPQTPPTPNPLAVDLWRQGEPIEGTLAQKYLRSRWLSATPPSLRFLPRRAHSYMNHIPFDAMVAAVQAADRNIIATQITWLAADGSGKAAVEPSRRTIGSLHDGAVRLGPAGDTLGLSEGVETGLAAAALTGVPCWAALGVRMHNVIIPGAVKEIHFFGDNGAAGHKAVEMAAAAHPNIRRVMRFPAPDFSDYADVLAGLAKREVAA